MVRVSGSKGVDSGSKARRALSLARAVVLGFAAGALVVLLTGLVASLSMSRDRVKPMITEARNSHGVAHATTHKGGDYYTDCALLGQLAVRPRSTIRNVIEVWFPPEMVRQGHPCDTIQRHATGTLAYEGPSAAAPYVYVSYWFGSQYLEAIVLRFVAYGQAETLYLVFSYSSILLLGFAAWRGLGRGAFVLIPVLAALLFAFQMHTFGKSLAHAPAFILGFALLAVMVAGSHHRFAPFERRLALFAFLATITTYFDLLNGPLLVMLSLSMVLNHFVFLRGSSGRTVLAQSSGIAGCFAACFVALSSLHLLLLSFFHDSVLRLYWGSLSVRLGTGTDTGTVSLGEVAGKLWDQRGNLDPWGVGPATWFLTAGAAAWILALVMLPLASWRQREPQLGLDLAVLVIAGAGVFAWYLLFPNHTFVHAWFAVRYLALPAGYGLAASLLVIGALRLSSRRRAAARPSSGTPALRELQTHGRSVAS